jgi:hypothetical protein
VPDERKQPCFAKGCFELVPMDGLFCPRHWDMLPAETQEQIKKAWAEERGAMPSARWAAIVRLAHIVLTQREKTAGTKPAKK